MCTVTYYQNNHQIFITSNRDEHNSRPAATDIQKLIINGMQVFAPIDPLKGGTWFVVNQKGATFVLMNGAFDAHISNPPYRLSRGLILLQIASAEKPLEFFGSIDLQNIENFTTVAYFQDQLYQLVWDGMDKHLHQLDAQGAYIWSSSTLYEKQVAKERELVFAKFLSMNSPLGDPELLLDFHARMKYESAQGNDSHRVHLGVFTKSITQAIVGYDTFSIEHRDLESKALKTLVQSIE